MIETMDKYDGLCNKIAMMRRSLLDEGYVIPSQFQLLEELQDEQNPNFLQEIFSLYFRDTIRQFGEIEKTIYQEPEGQHKKDTMNRFIYRFKGSVLRYITFFAILTHGLVSGVVCNYYAFYWPNLVVGIGALKTLYKVNNMLQFFQEDNTEGMIAAFEQVKVENENLRMKIEPYLELLAQVGSYEKADSPESQTGSSVTVEIPNSPGEVEGH